MEENRVENKEVSGEHHRGESNQKQIAGAILLAAIIIGGAILLKGSTPPRPGGSATLPDDTAKATTLAKVSASDRTLGNPNAKVVLVMYEDFQCPFCGKFFRESEQPLRDTYVKNGEVELVYRDFAFLGEESVRAAEAARCAGDQGKFWEYHDYLFTHQNGENQGAFGDVHLREFAKTLGLATGSFNQCLESGKYAQAVADSQAEGNKAGVNGTPKGYILKNGKTVDTIDGAMPYASVKQKIDSALR